MAYTSTPETVKNLVWDSNPQGTSNATLTNNVLTELTIFGNNGQSLVWTTDMAMLAHIKQVITDIQTEIGI